MNKSVSVGATNALQKCPEHICDGGSGYWAVTQICGQDKLWTKPDPKVLLALEDGTFCYCNCVSGKKYCYKENCVSNIPAVMEQCSIEQKKYQEFVTMTSQDPDPCECPCPHIKCNFCDEPDIKEFVIESCKDSGWWPGYPVVMSAGGGQFCTCLCPDDSAKTMLVKTDKIKEEHIHHLSTGNVVLAAGIDLNWKPKKIKQRTSSNYLNPIKGIRLTSEDKGLILAADQLVLTTKNKLRPALFLRKGDELLAANGSTRILNNVEIFDLYAAPLSFVSLSFDPPDKDLSGRLININGFVVGEYMLQIFYTLNLLKPELIQV